MTCSLTHLNVLLADGKTKPIGKLKVGDKLDTLHEHSLERDIHEVTYVEIIDSEVLCLTFEGKTFHCSPTHKFYLSKQKAWIEAKDLVKGQKVLQLDDDIEFIDATKIDDGKVVVISSWIKYCSSCASQMKVLNKAKNDFKNIEFFAFEVTKNEIASLLNVQYQTTLLIFKDNKEVYRSIGETTKDLIYEAIESSI